jgi:hypothetical protein
MTNAGTVDMRRFADTPFQHARTAVSGSRFAAGYDFNQVRS